ncbi:MAG TPA: zinc ribbon domain-containing protein [Candidatus Dormibacteraeota bacterium]|nr:zinc ribbon domain-containing protein [Candidatus Dormibacteraeota bacterium]
MLCTFCGTENRPEYKFCGTCGVRMERRQVERRTNASGVSAKCAGCGHVNEPGMKFCGMCGTRVERRMEERRGTGDEARAAAIANAQLPSPDVKGRTKTQVATRPEAADEAPVSLRRRGETAIFRNEPQRNEPSPRELLRRESGDGRDRISGPSFLGLNSQPDNNGEVEYLLEDEPTGGGLRKLLLLVILAAIIGLVFVQWRSSFKANPKPSAPAKSDPSTPSSAPQGTNQPTDPAGPSSLESPKVAATGMSAITSGMASELKAPRAEPTALEATSPARATPGTEEGASVPKSPTLDKALPDSDSKATEDARIPDYKPSAALVRAQQYIRGTGGVAQNCEQGLLYLHAATEKSDPGAAIQMAALYSGGICVKQDRVMAYRWFNSAHELQPANVWIQRNMDQLWAQMSSQERRLAGY